MLCEVTESNAESERRLALRRALTAEKDALFADRNAGRLSAENFEHLLADVDARLVELQLGDEQ